MAKDVIFVSGDDDGPFHIELVAANQGGGSAMKALKDIIEAIREGEEVDPDSDAEVEDGSLLVTVALTRNVRINITIQADRERILDNTKVITVDSVNPRSLNGE